MPQKPALRDVLAYYIGNENCVLLLCVYRWRAFLQIWHINICTCYIKSMRTNNCNTFRDVILYRKFAMNKANSGDTYQKCGGLALESFLHVEIMVIDSLIQVDCSIRVY